MCIGVTGQNCDLVDKEDGQSTSELNVLDICSANTFIATQTAAETKSELPFLRELGWERVNILKKSLRIAV